MVPHRGTGGRRVSDRRYNGIDRKQVLNLEMSSVFKKMVEFEPLRNASQRELSTILTPLNSSWWAFVNELLNLIEIASTNENDTATQPVRDQRGILKKLRSTERSLTLLDQQEKAFIQSFSPL
jgi:hypothetical protein